MAFLDNVSTEDLRQVLAEVEEKKPSQQLKRDICEATAVHYHERLYEPAVE